MRYRNKKTGALIESSGTLSGGDWQLEAAAEAVIEPVGKASDEADNGTSSKEAQATNKKGAGKK